MLFGVAINKSENICDVSEVITSLGLDQSHYSTQGVLMHDDGSAFIGLDKKFSMKNILCTKHVSNNILHGKLFVETNEC